MLRSFIQPSGSKICLVHRRSYAIMDRAKTRAGISLDGPPIKPPKKVSPTQQGSVSEKVIRYEKPHDRSSVHDDKSAHRRFGRQSRTDSRHPQQEHQLRSPRQPYKDQQRPSYHKDSGQHYPATKRSGYQHPLKKTLKEDSYDPWAPTPLKIKDKSTFAATGALQHTIDGDLYSTNASNNMNISPPADSQETAKLTPALRSHRERIMRLNEQKAAGMTERLIKPIKEFKQPENPHFIKVAVIGPPNAGKSTLVNKIVGEDVSIVSSKSHTTRERILAILSENNYQVVFLDTPGIISPKSKENMNRSITTSSWRSLDEADHVLIMVDSKYTNTKESKQVQEFMMERLSALDIPATLLFNKMDIIDNVAKESLEKLAEEFKAIYPSIRNQLYISALEEEGVNDVKDILFAEAKAKPWIYPPEQTVEISDLKRVEELIRVEFFKRLHRYIPYMLKQENMVWAELPNGTLRIEQNVYVERDSQHKIVVGANGMIINRVVDDARSEISKAFKRPVQLFIQVKTRKK